MVIKKCIICSKEFNAKSNAKCCSPECSKINTANLRRKAKKKYEQSEKGKATRKKAQKKYDQSHKGKARHKRYRESEKGKIAMNKGAKKYYENNKNEINIRSAERDKQLINELNSMYDGNLEDILETCPTSWREREAKMRVWFNESYADGIIAKIKSTPVCEVTGEKTNDLIIHHLYSFNTHPELGNDPANMVRIKKEVHEAFHGIYGYGNNTPEQWMEFIEKQYGGD